MSSPIDNASLAGRKTVEQSNPDSTPPSRAPVEAAPATQQQGATDDRVSLSTASASPPADSERIITLEAARETIAKLRELISANPKGALSAQQGLNTDTAASALGQAAA